MRCVDQIILTLIATVMSQKNKVQSSRRANDVMGFNFPTNNLHINVNTNTICGNTAGITRRQHQLCIKDPHSVAAALQGIKIAIYECQRQFKHHKWNCTSIEQRNKFPYAGPFFRHGFPEASFVHAITSAGVAHAVAKACSLGRIDQCKCKSGRSQRLSASQNRALLEQHKNRSAAKSDMRQYLWRGCDDDINFGIKFSQKFLDEREQASDQRSRAMLHNNRVGRLIVGNNMARKCTCHGTSGSCSIKTCWKHSPDLAMVAKTIKDLYFNATKIEPDNRVPIMFQHPTELNSNKIDYKRAIYPELSHHYYPPSVSINKLVYFEDPPNYCFKDSSIGHPGTTGRYCNRTSPIVFPGSCNNLCCERGYRTFRVTKVERCNCKFHWCCRVDCHNCTSTERMSVCR